MKKLKQILSKTWQKLSGKKTAIGLALHALWFGANIAFKDLSTPDESLIGHTIIGSITGTGLVHKGVKTEMGKKLMNKMKK